jgi:hypothetical protein
MVRVYILHVRTCVCIFALKNWLSLCCFISLRDQCEITHVRFFFFCVCVCRSRRDSALLRRATARAAEASSAWLRSSADPLLW